MLSAVRIDPHALLGEIAADRRDAGGDASLAPTNVPILAACRPVMLRRAVTNLVDNAVLHGGGVAELSVRREASGEIAIRVRDRGEGIDETRLEEAFEPFRRLEGSRSRATGGPGPIGSTPSASKCRCRSSSASASSARHRSPSSPGPVRTLVSTSPTVRPGARGTSQDASTPGQAAPTPSRSPFEPRFEGRPAGDPLGSGQEHAARLGQGCRRYDLHRVRQGIASGSRVHDRDSLQSEIARRDAQ